MSAATFRAFCKRRVIVGRHPVAFRECAETFEGAEGAAAFVAHMADVHGVKRVPGEQTPKRLSDPRPTPWKAPRHTAGGLDRLAASIAAGKYDVTFRYAGGTHSETARMGELVA